MLLVRATVHGYLASTRHVMRNGRSFAGFGRYGNQNRRTIRDRVTGGSGVTGGIAAGRRRGYCGPAAGLGAAGPALSRAGWPGGLAGRVGAVGRADWCDWLGSC